MSRLILSTPLGAVSAVAIDTETTGLDTAKAHLIDIAAVHIDGTRLDRTNAFESLIACPIAVPPQATAVHGITDAMLADAPTLATLLPAFLTFCGSRVWIGHTLGFDLTILARHAGALGIAFPSPPALDIRLLAQIAEPNLPNYGLEALAAWLGVTITERHRARGDAIAAAQIFTELVPKLRERNIRTVGEALAACRRVAEAMTTGQSLTGFMAQTGRVNDTLERLDSYPYRHRVRSVMGAPAVFIEGTATLDAAIRMMAERRFSSLLVGDPSAPADRCGIITERDTLRAIAREGAAALTRPVEDFVSRPVAGVPADAFLYRALGRMARLNVRHMAAFAEDGTIAGIVTARDLLRQRATAAIALGDDIDAAEDEAALGRAWAKLPAMAEALLAEAVEARDIAAIIAREMGALTRRATILAEREMAEAGHGPPPCPYAAMVLGSAGRGESLLAMDQDNALIFAQGAPDGPEDRWFQQLGAAMNRILNAVGVPYCKGGVMARESAYRGSVETWRRRIGTWLTRQKPEDLLSVDIVFDMAPVHGDAALALDLRRAAWAAARDQMSFLKLLAGSQSTASPFGLFGGIRADEDQRIDIKKLMLARIVPAVRILAIRNGVLRQSTADRIAELAAGPLAGQADLPALDSAHRLALRLLLSQQIADIAAGKPAGNRIAPDRLTAEEKRDLKSALKRIDIIDELVADRLMPV